MSEVTTSVPIDALDEDLPVLPAKAANILFFLIIATIVTFIAWASIAELDEVTRGSGRVIPSMQLQVVQNLEGGIVEDVLVHEGETVAAGQILMRLDTTQFAAAFTSGQEGFYALTARADRLKAEAQNSDLEFSPALASAAPSILAREHALYDARQAELKSEVAIKKSILIQRSRALSEAQVAAETARQAEILANKEVDMLAPLVAKGIEPRIELLRAQQRASAASGDIQLAKLAAERAQAALDEAKSGIKAVTERFRAQAAAQLTEAQEELANIRSELPALRDRVSRSEIRAPISGTINTVSVSTLGAVVQPGETLVELVPVGDTLLVEAFIDPKDIAFIRPGQPAQVKLTAYDFSIYGGLEGIVETISADAVEQEDRSRSYRITVRTGSDSLGKTGKDLPIIPGMVADVDVLNGKRTIMDYILSPIRDISERALEEG
ncbi:MAG: HlyD family type I secretion periplasmic adaptor subunit [Pseudomonadota bacterium]